MPDPIIILEAFGLSLLAAGAVLLLFGWPWRRPNRIRAGMGGVLGVGAGTAAGCWWLGMSPNWPPREDQDRLLFVLLPAVILVEAVVAFAVRRRWPPLVLRLALAGCAAQILLYGSSYVSDLTGPGSREWKPLQTTLIFGGLAAWLAVVWGALWLLAERAACRSILAVLAVVCAGASVAVMLSGYASGGQIGLPIAAALAGVVIASLALANTAAIEGALGVGVVSLFAILLIGRFFGQLSSANAALLFCAPLLAWGAELSFVRRCGSIAHGLARVGLPAVCVALVLLLAQRQFQADSSQTESSQETTVDDYVNFGK